MGRAPNWKAAEERPVIVLGAGGMLATALVHTLEEDERHYLALSEQDLDITYEGRVLTLLKSLNPGIVINAAAYTDVDGAETDRELAFAVNADGAGNVAAGAAAVDALMVQVSTDYVFDGAKTGPYLPDDPTAPISVYGESKLAGERQVVEKVGRSLIIRSSWLFGCKGKNFVDTMLRLGRERGSLKVVDDQLGSPTFTGHLAAGIMGLVNREVTGTYHLTNSGTCSWYRFAREIFRQAGLEVEVTPCATGDYPTPARRPANCVLDCSATYEILGQSLPTWQSALEEYLAAGADNV